MLLLLLLQLLLLLLQSRLCSFDLSMRNAKEMISPCLIRQIPVPNH